MFKRCLLFLVALGWTAVTIASGPLQSVMPLTTSDGRTFCTTFSINRAEHLWATAGHCAVYAIREELGMRIGGEWAEEVYVRFDATHDWAVLQADVAAKALPLAGDPLEVGDTCEIRGFPYGIHGRNSEPLHTWGRVSGRAIGFNGEAPISDVLDVTVAPGNSGSPVLHNNKVVGILWGRFNESEHSLSIPWEALRQNLSSFWES